MTRTLGTLHRGLWLWTALWLVAGACTFDTTALDERRCRSDEDCAEGRRCLAGICQGSIAGEDVVDAEDVVEEEVDACTDFDEDGVLGGVGCVAAPFDCNDFDPVVFPDADEVCDGKDNDCDELTDDDDSDYITIPCPRTQGVCTGSVRACVDGVPQACTDETYGDDFLSQEDGVVAACDGLDNDCDGETDENINQPCYTGDAGTEGVGLCVGGLSACSDGSFGDCEGEVTPVSEDTFETRCDTLDNDCDDSIDEECRCQPGEVRTCYPQADRTPTDHLPCRLGLNTCLENARFSEDCVGAVLPEAETCDDPGIDNDCDGDASPTDISVESTPGNFDVYGDTCDTGLDGVCAAGTFLCTDTGLKCVPDVEPKAETCDDIGVDNDCDGHAGADVDGVGDSCLVTVFGGTCNPPGQTSGCIYGECQQGMIDCEAGELICRPANMGTEEGVGTTCDDLDDDCNDTIDDLRDLTIDEANCGSCGNTCSGADDTCCDSECVDVDTDVRHCQTCGTECTGVDPDCCGSDGCADLDSDVDHCGDCGTACTGTDPDCCDGGCVDLDDGIDIGSDGIIEHCGTCGNTCGVGEQCCGGNCVALDDNDFCGDCATDCSDTNEACCNGDCADIRGLPAVTQPTGQGDNCGGCGIDCTDFDELDNPACCGSSGGACADLDNDPNNCGTCGTVCTGNDPACCSGSCVDLDNNEANCGACGATACGGSEQCCGGECISLFDADNCGDCDDDNGGTTNTDCSDLTGTTASDCCAGVGDAATCVDLRDGLDVSGVISHCGACDWNCGSGDNDACCGGVCFDTAYNITHCGGGGTDTCGTNCLQIGLDQRCCDSAGDYACLDAPCCGDGVCDGVEEDGDTDPVDDECPADCCGNGVCGDGETVGTCPDDC